MSHPVFWTNHADLRLAQDTVDRPWFLTLCGNKAVRRNIEFKRLTDVEQSEIIELMNNPLVRRQMPLAPDPFIQSDCEAFVAAKEQFWADYGYGPSAFVVDGRFAGWGGLQPEGGEADVGLVLHPDYWGLGKHLFAEIIFRAFGEMGFDAVTVLLPPTRTKIKGILRFGFKPDGTIEIEQRQFLRYRLKKSDARGLW